MLRLLRSSLLALPALLGFGFGSVAQAQCSTPGGCGTAGQPGTAGCGPRPIATNPGPVHPHFPPFGCGGYCIGFLSRIHFHGPLYNYGPYCGYYPFEPYGPWTSDLRYNGPRPGDDCGRRGGHGHLLGGHGWGQYSLSTLKNVFHRIHPLAHKCGHSGLDLGSCGRYGHTCSAATGCSANTCSLAAPAAVVADQSAQPATLPPALPQTMPSATGVLTGQTK